MFARGDIRRARTSGDLMGGLTDRLAARGHHLTEMQKIIGDGESFRQWCERLGHEGMKVDGKPFMLDDRPAMAWVYDQIPATRDEAYRLVLVLMKCAQVGFTVMEMLACIYLGLKFGPGMVAMFLPDVSLASMKSTERFMPVVRSIPSVHALMTQDDPNGGGKKRGEGNVQRRRIDQALFLFSWTSGRASTESAPVDVLSFDEVQQMTVAQMEKTVERLSASTVRFTLMGSTALWPEADIHHWYLLGTRHRFHTRCPTCDVAEPLDDYFPDCIQFDHPGQRWRYVCRAGHWIDDPQVGEWIAEDPSKDPPRETYAHLPKRDWPQRIRSIHFPQMLSPTISAGEIMDAYNHATDLQNFYNRKLGKPFLDPSKVPVTLAHLANCVAAGAALGVIWKDRARDTFMGIDQMGNFNVVVIKERLADGRQAVVHVEEIYSEDPFARCDELMLTYGVQCCVVEQNPNYNDASKFARRHLGRVFICNSFGAIEEGNVRWGDAPRLDVSERRTHEDERDRYTLRMDQFKCMQASMARFTVDPPMCVFPNPKELIQEVKDKGVKHLEPVLPRAFHHFTKTALVSEKDEDKGTNQYKRSVKKIGIDPHFSYANMLCDVAWSRAHGASMFLMPAVSDHAGEQRVKSETLNMHGLPTHVAAMIEDRPLEGAVCGRCVAYPRPDTGERPKEGVCSLREFVVGERDPACPMFDALSNYNMA